MIMKAVRPHVGYVSPFSWKPADRVGSGTTKIVFDVLNPIKMLCYIVCMVIYILVYIKSTESIQD